jgi:cell division protein FtsI/penicillin-binding protein 2
MVQVKFQGAALLVAAWLLLTPGAAILLNGAAPASREAAAGAATAHSLFAQSAARILDRDFASQDISFLLLDAQSGALIASRWPQADQPIPLGSLVKPFAALAYAQNHGYRYPIFVCRGAASGCWQPRPHGRLNISSALAYSCNSYFRDLTARLKGSQMEDVAVQFGLDPPGPRLTGPPLMGIGDQWRISPLHMAHAYLELIRNRNEPGVSEILAGLADSAQWGTGKAVSRVLKRGDAFVKTGTAVCQHTPRAPGDGFAIAITPSDQPQLLLMVRVHGVPGSRSALTAGRMLSRLEQ